MEFLQHMCFLDKIYYKSPGLGFVFKIDNQGIQSAKKIYDKTQHKVQQNACIIQTFQILSIYDNSLPMLNIYNKIP